MEDSMTKKYHVYGIGNALVDMEIEVGLEFLNRMGVKKGLMTLVDQNRQDELLSHITGPGHRRSCGGSAANTVIAVAQLGGKSFYSCKVAKDETGDFYFQDLRENGVETNLSAQGRAEGVTGKCMVFITPDADRTMNTYLGITETFSESELVESELAEAAVLYMEGYLVTSPTGRAAAIKAKALAKKHGVKTALTFSDPGIVAYFKAGLEEMVGDGVDIIFCNLAEAQAFTGLEDLASISKSLSKIAKSFAITMGPKGAFVKDGEREIHVLTNKVEAIDTNGAGDLFAGAYLYALTEGKDAGEAAKLACAAASKLVTKFGARLKRDEILAVKKEIFE
jgi:sugar/nucleoside kinase (ribokinase family)